MTTQAPVAKEDLAALQAKVATLEAERAAEHEAMTVAVKRVQDRASWARGLSLPVSSHLDGCPARPERIESFDAGRRSRTVRCQDCGAQEVYTPPTQAATTRRLEA